MRIAIGCDHRGLALKQSVMRLINEAGHSYKDFGCNSDKPVDYPDIAGKVARAVSAGGFEQGILICSTGIGMCIAANKVDGIRAALCFDSFCALRARLHNDANILCLGAEGKADVSGVVSAFLKGEFEGGRHKRRLDKIKALEGPG